MHRIDTPTAQADKFGPGKNGFTNGDPATGRRATDLNSDMWDAVQEEVCTVIEESGLTLNKDQHNQLYQAIVKIIASKIPDALLKKNNLSDLADKALARANLQLKTAAQKDIVTSKTDVTADRVVTTGWMSLGGYGTDNLIAAADAKKSLRNGFYGVQSEPTYGNSSLISFGYDSGSQVHIIAKQGGQAPLLGVCGSTPQGAFGNWGKIYTEFQKPTALDVGAVPYRGALGTDDLNTITGSRYGRFSQPLTANATAARHYPITEAGALDVHQTNANGAEACVQEYRSFNSRRIFLRTYNPTGSVWTDWCEFYTTAKKPTAADVGAIPLSGSTAVTGIVRSSTELQSSYANSFRIGYGGYGTFWRNDGANLYLMLTNQNDPWGNYNALRPFRVSLNNGEVIISKLNLSDFGYFDARYQAKGNYTPAGQAYTKAESDARYNLKNTATKTANSMYSKDASTGVITVAMSNITVGNNASVAVTFPTAFPNACVATVISYDGNGHGNDSDSAYAVTAYSKTGCTITAWNANGKFMLIATGY